MSVTPDPPPRESASATSGTGEPVEGGQLAQLKLQALSFSEKAILDAYTEALKNGLSAAADANGVLITASLAIATLYGTLIGLVSPKSQASPFIVVLPMVPLVGAFLAAVFGKTRGISFHPATTTHEVRTNLTGVVNRQRWGMRVAVTLLTVGLFVAGFILSTVYGGPAPAPTKVTVYLTSKGQAVILRACHRSVTSITGSLGTSPVASQDIVVVPTPGTPCGGQRIELTEDAVAAIK